MNITILKKYFRHFKKRALERYRIVLTDLDVCEICKLVLSGQFVFKARKNFFSHRYLLKIFFKGHHLFIVWDDFYQSPVTALPHSNLKHYC